MAGFGTTIEGTPRVRIPASLTIEVTDSGPPVQVVTATVTLPMPVVNLNYRVTTTVDGVAGLLREAIDYANGNTGGFDTISFEFPGPPYTIAVAAALPSILEGVLIDGRRQAGYFPGGTPIVELRGSAGVVEGLRIVGTGNNSTVRGLVVNGFDNGFYVGGGANNVSIDGNYIGTDVSGSARILNRNAGIYISGASNTNIVGNLISGQGTIGAGSEVDGIYVQSPLTGLASWGTRSARTPQATPRWATRDSAF